MTLRTGLLFSLGSLVLMLGGIDAKTEAAAAKDAFAERREAVLAEFDKDGDGRLSGEERAALRTSNKDGSKQKPDRREREEERHPPELLEKYDKDKSGWIDGDEWDVAGPAESAKIKKQFDGDKNDDLDAEEKKAMWVAIRTGKLKGIYAGIAHYFFLREDERKKGASYLERQRKLLKYDADGDGLASREELAAIRAARGQQD